MTFPFDDSVRASHEDVLCFELETRRCVVGILEQADRSTVRVEAKDLTPTILTTDNNRRIVAGVHICERPSRGIKFCVKERGVEMNRQRFMNSWFTLFMVIAGLECDC